MGETCISPPENSRSHKGEERTDEIDAEQSNFFSVQSDHNAKGKENPANKIVHQTRFRFNTLGED